MFLQFLLYSKVTQSQSSLCCAVGPHCPSIPKVTVWICQPPNPPLSHSLPTPFWQPQICSPCPRSVSVVYICFLISNQFVVLKFQLSFIFLAFLFLFFFSIFGYGQGIRKFLGQGLNLSSVCNLSHSCSNAGSTMLGWDQTGNAIETSQIINPLCYGRNY